MRGSIEALAQRLQSLVEQNAALQSRLEQSERARADLLAQSEHVIDLLEESRRELRNAKAQAT